MPSIEPNQGRRQLIQSFLLVGVVQGLVQLTGILSGLLIVNLLSIEEYAYYTLANSFLGTMTVLADGGISKGVTSEGGKVWQNDNSLSKVVSTGVYLRKQFARIVLVVMLPILLGLLMYNGAALWQGVLVCLSIIPIFLATLTTSIIQIPERLRQNVKFLQRVDVEGKLIKLISIVLTLPLLRYAFVAVGATALAQMWINKRLRKTTDEYIDLSQPYDPEVKERIITVVKRILPTSIYYAVSSQLSVLLISFFGNTDGVAQIGALGRFSAIFAILKVLIDIIIVPRFARLREDVKPLIIYFFASQLGIFTMAAVTLLVFYLLSDYALMLLGEEYAGLNYELILVISAGCMSLLSSSTNNILSARAIIVPPTFFIIYSILVQIFTIWYFPVSTLVGVIKYGIANVTALYLLRIFYFSFTIKRTTA